MTVGNSSLSNGEPRAWAAEILGTSPDGAPAEFTAALLRRLVEEDFVPPPVFRMAWETAVRPGAEGCRLPPLEQFCEERLSVEIEQFAGQFFTIPRPQRVQRWQLLFDRAERFPRCRTRLPALQPGLKVDLNELPPLEPDVAALAKSVIESFVLRPSQRATRRRELMRSRLTSDDPRAQAAARQLLKQVPALAALVPELVDLLANWAKTSRLAATNRRKRLAYSPTAITTTTKTRSNGSSSSRIAVIVAVLAITNVLRSLVFDNSRPYSPPPPNFSQPAYSPSSDNRYDDTRMRDAMEIIQKALEKRRLTTPGARPPDAVKNNEPSATGDGAPAPDESRSAEPDKLPPPPSDTPTTPNPGSARPR